jgi:enamidase
VAEDALASIERGDIPGIAAVVIDGVIRALRSRNTPAPSREARLAEPTVPAARS